MTADIRTYEINKEIVRGWVGWREKLQVVDLAYVR